ncbi:hypothetical protein Leryth_026593 [Lithospermum erythrorhizon]|nr:hypothetical protein Leryth_026593 [Lithospermum erythrorhizon]
MNDTRTRVNNKRIPKNVAPVSTDGIALNSKDEEARWKFIYNRRLAPERETLSDNLFLTYFRDVDDAESDNYHKVTLRNFVFNFSLDLDNQTYGRTNVVREDVVAIRQTAAVQILQDEIAYLDGDTLYVHSLRQFYRECDIYGTVDFIFGNAAAVFQNCNIYARKPMPNQKNTITF